MLVLSRKSGEKILIGDNIEITILRTGNVVRVGVDAPRDVSIRRAELDALPREESNETELANA